LLFTLLEQLFKVSPNSSYTGAQPITPPVQCLVDGMLSQTRPWNNLTLQNFAW